MDLGGTVGEASSARGVVSEGAARVLSRPTAMPIPYLVHATTIPRRGNNNSPVCPALQRGHRGCAGKVVAPQSPH
ncbi:hypothetical protein ABH37_02690 [Mycobacterium haemophilum]|nr:hypothetical protein ABH39_11650 [Mycobacterium haemophilum]KLO44848.1 hypothetical protein ABH37_02690 [Mycobacterium haemophilum]